MTTDIHINTRVLPGNRIEVVDPQLTEGQEVEVIVRAPSLKPRVAAPGNGIADFLRSLPPSTRTAEEWEQIERDFQRERDSWDR